MIAMLLATRQWFARPLRPLLCSLAIAAGVALVVCVGAGFDSARASLQIGIGQLLGVADIHVRPPLRGLAVRLPGSMLEHIKAIPEVQTAGGRIDAQVSLTSSGQTRIIKATGVDPATDQILRPKIFEAGRALSGDPGEIVLDVSVAEELPAKVGDQITVSSSTGVDRRATVVGILEPSQIHVLIVPPSCYIPNLQLIKDVNHAAEYNVIDLKCNPGVNVEKFAADLQKQLGDTALIDPAAKDRAHFDQQIKNLNIALISLSMVTGLCAALIIGTTLSVAVQERIRQFGQLRCIGASRGQLVAILTGEALILMLLGTAIGLLLGYACSRILVHHYSDFFVVYKLGPFSVITAIANAVVFTFLGSMIPALQVARVTPMQAVQSAGKSPRLKLVWIAGGIGAGLICVQLLLWQIPNKEVRFWSYILLGIPLIFAGYATMGPAVILLAERTFARILGPAFGVKREFLQQAWSRTPWRAGGMIAALMIGITIFVSVHTRAATWTQSLAFADKFPDLFLFSKFDPIPEKLVATLQAKIPDITAVTGINAVWVWQKTTHTMDIRKAAEESTLFVAIEPNSFRQMVELNFLQGNADTAYARLNQGGAVLISKEYHEARGVNVGDHVNLVFSDGVLRPFEIVGVCDSPSINIAKLHFDVSGAFQDAALTSVVGTLADARKYMRSDPGIRMLLINVDRKRPPQQILDEIRGKVSDDTGSGGLFGRMFNITKLGLQSASAVEMKEGLSRTVSRVVRALSLIAIAAMALASLGVANMVIASVQARQFEFGVLRAVGAGRGQLIRMVLAESAFISIVAALLGTITGLHYAFMATRVDRLMLNFESHFGLPWLALLAGLGITLLLGLLASIGPAIRGAMAAQRVLLAGGRG